MVDGIAVSLEIEMTGVIAIAIGGAIDMRGTTVMIATIAGTGGIGGPTTATESGSPLRQRDSQ
jgi:hypothetical protein